MRGRSARELTETEVIDIAVRYLARREYGVEELRQKLMQRGAGSEIAGKVVEDLANENLVSDQRFTEMFVRTRMHQLNGPVKIRGQLRGLGVSDQLIAQAMPDERDTWFEIASKWAGKRSHGELDYAGRVKLYRGLINRGFTHEQANAALDRLNSTD
ncbi:MAG: regulatory protein RecX [Lysobacterales bacterium]